MRRIGAVAVLILGLAFTCQAQPVRSVCVMPVEENQVLRHAIEHWLQAKGLQTVDCLKYPDAGDAVLGFFWNRRPVMTDEYFVYAQGVASGDSVVGSVTVIRNIFPAGGLTIWLQSHAAGNAMLYYGQRPNLLSGLKSVVKCAVRGKDCGFR